MKFKSAFTLCAILRELLARSRKNSQLLTQLLKGQETIMSEISREAQESRAALDALKQVVTEVVQRLLDERAADKATIAQQAARIAEIEGVEVDANAAAAELDAQQQDAAAFAEQLKTVGIDVQPPAGA
jgi:flagellar hook-basal body complex protein FliE